MTEQFSIYYDDLTDDKKSDYLDFCGVESESELNHQTVPIAIIEMEREEANEQSKRGRSALFKRTSV